MLKKILLGSIIALVILSITTGFLYANQKGKTQTIQKSAAILAYESETDCNDKKSDCTENMGNDMMNGGMMDSSMMNGNMMNKTMISDTTNFKEMHNSNQYTYKNGDQKSGNCENNYNCYNITNDDGNKNCTMMEENNQTCPMTGS